MRLLKPLMVLLITVLAFSVGYSSPPKINLKESYTSQIGVKETPKGSNWGPEIKMYLSSVNVYSPAPWCAAFVKWNFNQAGITSNITAWSPTAQNSNNLVYYKAKFYKQPRAGDVFTLYFPSLKRIAHTGFFDLPINNKVYRSVEGNTNQAGSREGDGVYYKYRSYRATFSLTRWE